MFNFFKKFWRFPRNRRWMWGSLCVLLAFTLWFWQALPDPLFNKPYSLEVQAHDGQLLGARIASDGQWRFPQRRAVPTRFAQALLTFEDKRFFNHFGVDLLAVARATESNLKAGRVVSGASTLSMQTIRLARDNPSRNILEKCYEMLLAVRLECSYSKQEILALWASHAPFGGNVVGLDAASWRYFGRSADRLSWGEAAMLAVLPNAPSLMHPGRNRELLKAKRDLLLDRMFEQGILNQTEARLAKVEQLPQAPLPLPDLAPHLTNSLMLDHPAGARVETTVWASLQARGERLLARYQSALKQNRVQNLAALVLENRSGAVVGYFGNTTDTDADGHAVDVIQAPRSTGSLLKPFLHAGCLEQGILLPQMLLPDVPTRFGSFAPKNFDYEYHGVVPADEALARSLNITATRLQRQYGTASLMQLLQQFGMNSLDRDAEHYGLSLVLGGAEGTMWELASMYASLARTLQPTVKAHVREVPYFQKRDAKRTQETHLFPLDPGAVWFTLESMTQLERPASHGAWRTFASRRRVAWKTGTSQGFRDAWSVGVTPEYTVAVWVGNASGEGRPGLTGIQCAAPMMFELFDLLPQSGAWFQKPHRHLKERDVCRQSGYLAGRNCNDTHQVSLPKGALRAPTCPFHKLVFLNADQTAQVSDTCLPPPSMQRVSWFVLPPGWAWFYQKAGGTYLAPPPFLPGCEPASAVFDQPMAILSPQHQSQIYVPRELSGSKGRAIFEVAHQRPDTLVYWHLNEEYLGYTQHFHTMEVNPNPGEYVLTIVDEDGFQQTHKFEVLGQARDQY